MTILFCYPRKCDADSINSATAPLLSGNDMRVILNRYIDNNLTLKVTYFHPEHAVAFRREFIEPALDSDGYPVKGKYSVKSSLLNGRKVEYLVDIDSYKSSRYVSGSPNVDTFGITTMNEWYKRMIKYMKYGR